MGIFSRVSRSSTSMSSGSETATLENRVAALSLTTQKRAAPQPGSKIQTVMTDRPAQQYAGEPSESGVPDFTRTGSFYQGSSSHDPNQRYYQASDVRRQVREAPAGLAAQRHYPRVYHNQPPLPLSSAPPYREFPIVPSPQDGSTPKNFTRSDPTPGPVRAFYNENDRSTFDVGYKDVTLAPRGPRNGRQHGNSNFSLATYHPAPTHVDCSSVKR
ncbi:hypothetical protein CMEL01_11869 [Colletotrichum melonis]|uniref:Uncharacterized protein n=1 Tax=Colletotrichum melonis TaxID=1209925 RepID=A0AAI9UW68_9PEZI|nr:hypothetical protein CMEL01_11869 [Colletotrichum melonis]